MVLRSFWNHYIYVKSGGRSQVQSTVQIDVSEGSIKQGILLSASRISELGTSRTKLRNCGPSSLSWLSGSGSLRAVFLEAVVEEFRSRWMGPAAEDVSPATASSVAADEP
jgi:hypothetical protein